MGRSRNVIRTRGYALACATLEMVILGGSGRCVAPPTWNGRRRIAGPALYCPHRRCPRSGESLACAPAVRQLHCLATVSVDPSECHYPTSSFADIPLVHSPSCNADRVRMQPAVLDARTTPRQFSPPPTADPDRLTTVTALHPAVIPRLLPFAGVH
jgi:hypothetical protein